MISSISWFVICKAAYGLTGITLLNHLSVVFGVFSVVVLLLIIINFFEGR